MTGTGPKTISIQKLKCSPGSDLYGWFSRYAQSGLQKRDLKVKQVGSAGEIVKTWRIVQAGPLNMSMPEPMNADANLVLIETLTLTYEKIEPDW